MRACQGFDPSLVNGDELFVLDTDTRTYVPLTDTLYRAIKSNRMRSRL